jgi:four helix bundle protein
VSRARRVASEATLDTRLFGGWREGDNPEVTMHQTATGFDVHDKAITAAGLAIGLVMRVPSPLKPIADQVIRSASSVPANIDEGAGRIGRDRLHHYRIAYASAREVDSHLRLLCISGAIPPEKASAALNLFDDVDGASDAPPPALTIGWL